MSCEKIIITKDTAQSWEVFKQEENAQIITASQFFEKFLFLPFLYDDSLTRSDIAPLILSLNYLKKYWPQKTHLAKSYAKSYKSILYGVSYPSQINTTNFSPDLKEIFHVLLFIEQEMANKKIACNVTALKKALEIMTEKEILIPFLAHRPQIHFKYLIDLTYLEVAIIKKIASFGIEIKIILPLLFDGKGINKQVNYLASLFEKDGLSNIELVFEDLSFNAGEKKLLTNLLDKSIADKSVESKNLFLTEAGTIAQESKAILNAIAKCKDENKNCRISLSARTIDAEVLKIKDFLQNEGVSIKDRKGPPILSTFAGKDFIFLLEKLSRGILLGDMFELMQNENCAYFYLLNEEQKKDFFHTLNNIFLHDLLSEFGKLNAIKRANNFFKINESESKSIVLNLMNDVFNLSESLKKEDSFIAHLNKITDIFAKIYNYSDEDPAKAVILETIHNFKTQKNLFDDSILWSFDSVFSIIKKELQTKTLPSEDNKDLLSIELLPMPELLGRSFDIVILCNFVLGKVPLILEQDHILPDNFRIEINKACKRSVLKIFFDDPFEPTFVPPRLALEPFWFAGALAAGKQSIFLTHAKLSSNDEECAPADFFTWVQDKVTCNSFNEDKWHIVFKNELNNTTFDYKASFIVNKSLAKNLITGKSLSASMLDSLNLCPFLGVYERIFLLDSLPNTPEDTEPKTLGVLAHKILYTYFKNGNDDINKVFDDVLFDFQKSAHFIDINIFLASTQFLKLALHEFIKLFEKGEVNFAKKPYALERFLTAALGEYKLAGVLDRVDINEDEILITDYKLSSLKNLRMKDSFQAPVYQYLAHKNFTGKKNVKFIFASIKDNKLLKIGTVKENLTENLKENIDKVMQPILDGRIEPKQNDHCHRCHLKFCCRIGDL